MQLKAGDRLASTACSTEVIVIRPPSAPIDLRCGGEPMAAVDPAAAAGPAGADASAAAGVQLGKRYASDELGLELLVTRAGAGPLEADGHVLEIRQAKPLPSSD